MNPDHAEFAEWDAAYVLGALSPSDRRSFEAHLESCERCRSSVAEIAPTLGLLARLDAVRAESLLHDHDDPASRADPDAERRAVLVALGERAAHRRNRRWITGYVAAALIIVAIAISAPFVIAPGLRDGRIVALESVSDVPIEAAVELTAVDWGTRLALECSYLGYPADAPEGGWPYGLFITAIDGTTSEVSSWRAAPGATARLSAATALDVADIAAIEIRSLTTDRVLMRTELQP